MADFRARNSFDCYFYHENPFWPLIMKFKMETICHDAFCGVISMQVICMWPIKRPNQWYKFISDTPFIILKPRWLPYMPCWLCMDFFNCLSYIHVTQGWYWFKAQNPLFVLSLRGYNKAYPRFILELKMAVIGWPPKNKQILSLWMTVIDNVRIW